MLPEPPEHFWQFMEDGDFDKFAERERELDALVTQFADRCFDGGGEGASYPSVLQAMRDLADTLLGKRK
jgi:hypothetical protein